MSEWRELAACRDSPTPDVWFPERGESCTPALEICGVCPVTSECLVEALRYSVTHGIWGGTTYKERRRMRRRVA